MKCKSAIGEELISAFVDGEIAPAERQRLSLHFAECAACESTRAALTAFKALLKEKSLDEVLPANFWMRIQANLDRIDKASPARDRLLKRQLPWTVWAPVLVMALVAVIVVPSVKLLNHQNVPLLVKGPQTLDVAQLVKSVENHLGNDDSSCECSMKRDFRDSREAAAWVSQQVGSPLSLPPLETAGYRVVKAGLCGCSTQGRSALYICQKGNQTVAFIQFLPERGGIKLPKGSRQRIDDRDATVMHQDPMEVIGWHDKEGAYAVLGNQQYNQDLVQLASLRMR